MYKYLILFHLVLLLPSARAHSHELGLRGETFANEENYSARLDLGLHWESENKIEQKSKRELLLSGFMESGNLGDRSLDIDRLAYRVEWFPGIYSWFGRSQPFFETGVFQPTYRSAIGSQWSQNQSNPLQPKISGWVGGGLEFKKSDWSFAIAYSPFFLPNFGPRVAFVQIAGFIARRIVCYVEKGESLSFGERYGMIRFGSRMEIVVPIDSEILVQPGQKTDAGVTKLARFRSSQS